MTHAPESASADDLVLRAVTQADFPALRALIEVAAERARAGGAQRLYWQTYETNEIAMKLYGRVAEKSGFLVYRMDLS